MTTVSAPASASSDTLPGAVVCDLSPLSILDVTGEDAPTFLQGQLSSDTLALAPGTAQYTSYNSPKGRMLANFVLWREPVMYRALMPGDIAEQVRKRLTMFVLRSKVKIVDASARTVRLGLGGAEASRAIAAALGVAPAPFVAAAAGSASVLTLPGPRYVVIAPVADAPALHERLSVQATPAPFDTWRWLTIRAGVPVVTAATQDQFVPQTANWDVLGGVSFRKGCYTGQEVIARMQYLGRLKERLYAFRADVPSSPGTRLYGLPFADQPCGTVVDSAPAPAGGGHDLLAVVQTAAVEAGDVRLGSVEGPPLTPRALPYAVPAPTDMRGRAG
jgi:tRNA-modifying protein YgfZ